MSTFVHPLQAAHSNPAREALAHHLRQPPVNIAPREPIAQVIISIKPSYARLIADGSKRVEFRRRFPHNITTARAIFYVSSPACAITLTARIATVRRAAPKLLWREFSPICGTTRDAFNAYFTGAPTGVALLLEDVRLLPSPIALAAPRLRAANFRPPQSLIVLPPSSPMIALFASF